MNRFKYTLRDRFFFIFLISLSFSLEYLSCVEKQPDSQQEDILTLRRILSLHEKGEDAVVREQGSLFLARFPNSPYRCYVLMMLGDQAVQQGQMALAQSYYERLAGTALEMQGEIKIWEILARQEEWSHLQERIGSKKDKLPSLSVPLEKEAVIYFAALASWHQGQISALQDPEGTAASLKNLQEPPYHLLGPLLAIEIYQVSGNEKAAASLLCKLSKSDSKQSEEYLFSAAALLAKSSPEASACLYRRIIEMEGHHVLEACIAYARLINTLGTGAEGYHLIKNEVEKHPQVLSQGSSSLDLLVSLSLLAYQLNEAEDLYLWSDRYQQQAGIDEKARKLFMLCGELAAKQGNNDAAIRYYHSVSTKLDDLSLRAELLMGKVLIQEGRGEEAKRLFAITAKKFEKHPQAYQVDLLLAQAALLGHQDYASYVLYLKKAWEKYPPLVEEIDIHRQLFKAYYQLGQYPEAAASLKQIYLHHPETLTAEERRWFNDYADQHPQFLTEKESALLLTEVYTGYREKEGEKEIAREEFGSQCDLHDPRVERRLVRYVGSYPLAQEDPLFCLLQQVAYCRTFDHEPNHFEAALTWAEKRYHDNPIAWYSHLLSFKEWFLSKEDIPARDYHAAKEARRGGVQLFEGYMLLIDGELTRLEAEIAFQQGREGEGRKKREIAVKIYKNLLHSAYGVTPYLLEKAKERSAQLEQKES